MPQAPLAAAVRVGWLRSSGLAYMGWLGVWSFDGLAGGWLSGELLNMKLYVVLCRLTGRMTMGRHDVGYGGYFICARVNLCLLKDRHSPVGVFKLT